MMLMSSDKIYDKYIENFERCYRNKKYTNLIISAFIVLFGISSFIFGLHIEPRVTIFRFLTVDGTLFSTFGAAIYIIANIIEIRHKTELTSVFVYYIRLSCAVAEMVIFLVVMLSHLPFFSESIPIADRYDSFIMHALVPPLTVASFVLNDSPIGRLKVLERLHGTWFVTFYAVVILTLIVTDRIEGEMIPYFFLDVKNNPVWLTILAFIIIYGIGYLMGWFLSEANRRLSWLWFKGFNSLPTSPSTKA